MYILYRKYLNSPELRFLEICFIGLTILDILYTLNNLTNVILLVDQLDFTISVLGDAKVGSIRNVGDEKTLQNEI